MAGKWRYLGEKDPAEVPNNWRCSFNSDSTYQSCSDPEEIPTDAPKNAWVENRFTVGSLVWAKVAGWPWWPAIVDDDPDTGMSFMLNAYVSRACHNAMLRFLYSCMGWVFFKNVFT